MANAQTKESPLDQVSETPDEDEADIVFEVDDDEDIWDDSEEPIISDEEVLEGFRDAVRELKLCLEGKAQMQPIENLFAELEREDIEDDEAE